MADFFVEIDDKSEKLLERLADLIEKTTKTVATPSAPPKLFDETAQSGGGIGGAISAMAGSASAFLSKVSAPFIKLFDKLAAMASGISLVGDKFDSLQSKIGGFVQHISPGSVTQMDFALKDLFATIGQILLPVFEALTPIVEKFADVLANIDFEPIITPLVELTEKLADAFFLVLEACQPLITILVDVLGKVIKALIPLVDPLAKLFAKVAEILTPVIELIGEGLVKALELLAVVLGKVIGAVGSLTDAYIDRVNDMAAFIDKIPGMKANPIGGTLIAGLESADAKDKKQRARAGRGVSFEDIEGASKRASAATAMMGGSGKTTPSRRQRTRMNLK